MHLRTLLSALVFSLVSMTAHASELQSLVTQYEQCIKANDELNVVAAKSSCSGKLNAALAKIDPAGRTQLKTFMEGAVDRYREKKDKEKAEKSTGGKS